MNQNEKTRPIKTLAIFSFIGFSLLILTLPDFILAADAPAGSSGENMARGKTYTLDPAPNYRQALDPKRRLLTDGLRYDGTGCFWTQKTNVGWGSISHALITIDLGRVEPIGGVSFHTAFDGPINVGWPQSIKVFVSDDNKEFVFARDLVDPRWKDCFPPTLGEPLTGQKKTIHLYTGAINARGRYVCFAARYPSYVFCDEIEVCRGNAGLVSNPAPGEKISNIKAFLQKNLLKEKSITVLLRDLGETTRNASRLDARDRDPLARELSRLEERINAGDFSRLDAAEKIITPLNSLHQDLLRVNARILKAGKYPPLFAWHKNRWDPLEAVEIPPAPPTESPALSIEMMDGEYRAEALNLTNATENDLNVEISLAGLPGGAMPEYLSIFQVEFVGTQKSRMIADPLCPAQKGKKGWKATIPGGMTRQIWLTFNPRGIKAGLHQGTVKVKAGALPQLDTPISLRLYPVKFPKKTHLSLALWDYTDKPYGFKMATDQNVPLAIKDMREHFVSAPFGHRNSACWPKKEDFDAEGNLVNPLQTSLFDEWITHWKGSRHYFCYIGNALENFCGEPMGTPRFNNMVRQWAAAFAGHARKMGIQPDQIGLLLYDEPHKDEPCNMNTLWAKAIKSGAPDFRLFTDASGYEKPSEALRKMVGAHDIICPHLPFYGGINADVRNVAKSGTNQPKTFWLYSCMGPARLFDPYYYHRLQAWHCWRDGAVGMGFWNYWNYYPEDNCTAWNELLSNKETWGVTYATRDSITGGKHWEAIREGVEDYEYLHMLSTRIGELKKKGVSNQAVQDAEPLLRTLPAKVAAPYDKAAMSWFAGKDRSVADRARIQILEALEKLN
ncbi:MAG: hypothetical protein PHV34_13630 [Verrucomicrobiae bacterium]|nr:hypothetical protein [Verrucomicrobiae bacterium]